MTGEFPNGEFGADEFHTWDAAYVLGALTPQERSVYEQHLAHCPVCQESVRSLAGMPGLLAAAAAPEQTQPPPATLLPRLVREVRHRRRRSRYAFGATALAAAASLIAVLVLALNPGDSSPTRLAMTQTVPSPLNADAVVTDAHWGTKIDVNCRYKKVGTGYTPRLYRLQVNDKAGHHDEIASWDAIPGETMKVEGVTRVPRSDITSIEIRTDSGKPILRLGM